MRTLPIRAKNGPGMLAIVLGLQWGDEGKGKLIAHLIQHGFLNVVRFNGGNNAGHTAEFNGGWVHTHSIPMGIINPNASVFMSAGELFEPFGFLCECAHLRRNGIKPEGRIFIDPRANVTVIWHRAQDLARERKRGTGAIGTTARGIGPAMQDLVGRNGIQLSQVLGDTRQLAEKMRAITKEKNNLLRRVLGISPEQLRDALCDLSSRDRQAYRELIQSGDMRPEDFDYPVKFLDPVTGMLSPDKLIGAYAMIRDRLLMIIEMIGISDEIHKRLAAGLNVLAEGANGSMLDVLHGSFPYVTSAHTLAGAACTGIGIGPTRCDVVVGVAKLFTTRVGGGPFPTEDDQLGQLIRGDGKPGTERGTTTGRDRRIGWLDLPLLRRTIRLNGATHLFLTKLDFLDSLPEIKVCVGYEINGEHLNVIPADADDLARVKPVYVTLPGWQQDTSGCRTMDDLPKNAQAYVQFVLNNCCPPNYEEIELLAIGVGARSDQIIEIAA